VFLLGSLTTREQEQVITGCNFRPMRSYRQVQDPLLVEFPTVRMVWAVVLDGLVCDPSRS